MSAVALRGLGEFLDRLMPRSWMRDAACGGMDQRLFFPERGQSTATAKAVCADCPVSNECLGHALRLEDEGEPPLGIWGGLSPAERTALRLD